MIMEIEGSSVQVGQAKQTCAPLADQYKNLKVTLGTRLDETNDSITSVPAGYTPVNLSASGVISAFPCKIAGFIINSTDAGTIKIWDNTAGSGDVVVNTATLAVGAYNLFNADCAVGAYATIAGTALDITFFVKAS